MRKHIRTLLTGLSAACLCVFTAQLSQAQITHRLKADIHHDFMIGNTTLPAGTYVFHILADSENQVMNVKSVNGDLSEDFLVRQADDNTVPNHAELIFDRYGNEEFLNKVFAPGEKIGVAVVEPSREEAKLDHQGQHYIEHTETESY